MVSKSSSVLRKATRTLHGKVLVAGGILTVLTVGTLGVLQSVIGHAATQPDLASEPQNKCRDRIGANATSANKAQLHDCPYSTTKPASKPKPATKPKPSPPTPAKVTPKPALVATPAPESTAAPVPRAQPPSGTMKTGFITGYTIHDNDPPGSKEIAYSNQWDTRTLHSAAGGIGTYDDPITLAAQAGDYAPGTRFYLPHVDRYFILEDTCASCGEKPEWIDMWIAGELSDNATATDACARQLTGMFTFEVNPPRGRHVVSGSLFNSAQDTCYSPTP